MIDFHCHLDLYPDALELLPIVAKRNIFTLVVTTSPRAWEGTSRVFAGYDNIKVALGMHPEIVDKKANERTLLMSCIAKAKFVGEIGLDGSQVYKSTLPLQEAILIDTLIECERVGGKILSLHSRNASSRVLDLIEQYCQNSKPVLHWFSGTIRDVRRAISLGCWFSVGPAMIRGTKGYSIVKELPKTKVLPETDGPFATNHSIPFMPWEAINITDSLTNLWGLPKDGVALQIKKNLSTLLGDDNILSIT
jgi:TatD DNase family protein